MTIKKQYEMNDVAWVHLGDGKLHKGKVVDIFDLEHAGYSKDIEFYIVEIQTGIDPILEVRTWEQMSSTAKGPIGIYKQIKEDITVAEKKFLGKVGIELPLPVSEIETDEIDDPTPEQVNAAIERAERAKNEMYRPMSVDPELKKRRNQAKGKPYAKRARRPTM